MSYREAQTIEQCIGCGDDVAIYSDRQRVNGEAFCSGCRRIHRKERKIAAKLSLGLSKVQTSTAPKCAHARTGMSPTGVIFCLECLGRVG